MKKLLSEKDKDEYDSGDELELFPPSIAAIVYSLGFNGDGDLSDHLGMFNTLMMAHNISPELRCLIFPSTLIGPARQWFKQCKKQSISSWKNFSADFKRAFRASQAARVKVDTLTNVKQQPGEPLKAYLSRFANIVA